MESVKALLKSKSSHELISSGHSTNSHAGSATKNGHNSSGNSCTNQQLLQVPNARSAASSLVSSSVSESSELSQVSDCEPNEANLKENNRKLKKLQKSIRKQRKRHEKQLAELVQFLHVDKTQQFKNGVKFDEDDLKYLNSSSDSRLNKSLQEYLDPDAYPSENKRKVTVCKSLDVDNRPTIKSKHGSYTVKPVITAHGTDATIDMDARTIITNIHMINDHQQQHQINRINNQVNNVKNHSLNTLNNSHSNSNIDGHNGNGNHVQINNVNNNHHHHHHQQQQQQNNILTNSSFINGNPICIDSSLNSNHIIKNNINTSVNNHNHNNINNNNHHNDNHHIMTNGNGVAKFQIGTYGMDDDEDDDDDDDDDEEDDDDDDDDDDDNNSDNNDVDEQKNQNQNAKNVNKRKKSLTNGDGTGSGSGAGKSSDQDNHSQDDNEDDYAEANERTLTNNDTITAGGFRRIRRFGYNVSDGCGFPLSMKREQDDNEHTLTLTRRRSWKDIIARADEYVFRQTNGVNKSVRVQQLFQVCPCPEIQCHNSLTGMLPFRRWNSECRLNTLNTLTSTMDAHTESMIAYGKRSAHVSRDLLSRSSTWATFNRMHRPHSCEDLRHLSGCSLRNTQNHLKNHHLSSPMSRPASLVGPALSDMSACGSSEVLSERSTSCSLQSVSSSCSSISGVSTLIALDLNQSDVNPFEVFNQNFEPALVALELTKLEQELFLQLNPTELSRQLFTSNRSINLNQFFEMHCIYFYVQLILNENELSGRVQCLLSCIELLDELYQLRNWQSFDSLLIALHCIPIVRLRRSWIALRSMHPQAYERFCSLTAAVRMQNQSEPHLMHTHNQASIPCLSELLDEMRARVAFKLNRLDNRRPTVFGKPETLTDWLTSEVRDLETRLYENQRWQEAEQEARDKNRKQSGLIKKIFKSFMKRRKRVHKNQNTDELRSEAFGSPALFNNSMSNGMCNDNDQNTNSSSIVVNSSGIGSLSSGHASSATIELLHTDEDVVDDELIMMKTINSNQRLQEWREIQMDLKLKLNKLKPETENSLLNEISKCLRFHQQLACNYNFNTDCKPNAEPSDQDRTCLIIRKCLAAITKLKVNTMQENMRKSLQIEPSVKFNGTQNNSNN